MFDFENEFGGFYVNIDEVIKSRNSMAVTRLLAADLKARPYLKVGEFMESLADDDLDVLLKGSEPDENDQVKFDDLLLIAMMLNNAEGLPPVEDAEGARELLGKMITFLAVEGLARKKLIRAYRENMSFGDDVGELKIAEKL